MSLCERTHSQLPRPVSISVHRRPITIHGKLDSRGAENRCVLGEHGSTAEFLGAFTPSHHTHSTMDCQLNSRPRIFHRGRGATQGLRNRCLIQKRPDSIHFSTPIDLPPIPSLSSHVFFSTLRCYLFNFYRPRADRPNSGLDDLTLTNGDVAPNGFSLQYVCLPAVQRPLAPVGLTSWLYKAILANSGAPNMGDKFNINLDERDDDASIQWHAFFQPTNSWADGVAFVSQCPIGGR
ncbi:hypothetical protein C8R46DRAFT_1220738 [Mycena filopes]|nr:hypothetical protein C8R46DRAFT_1220738 [Mycena filopes]